MSAIVGRSSLGFKGFFREARTFGVLVGAAIVLAGAHARGAEPGPEPGLPEGAPPDVAPAAPGWTEEDRPIYYDVRAPSAPAAPRQRGIDVWLGGHTFLATDKVMPGFDLRIGKRPLWVDLEASFVWLSEPARELESTFLGNHFGAFFMVAPFRYRWFQLRAGAGGDFFPLWNIDANEWHAAFSARGSAHLRLWPRVEAFATARAFIARSDGLELGTTRDGRDGLPILFSLGLAWRTAR